MENASHMEGSQMGSNMGSPKGSQEGAEGEAEQVEQEEQLSERTPQKDYSQDPSKCPFPSLTPPRPNRWPHKARGRVGCFEGVFGGIFLPPKFEFKSVTVFRNPMDDGKVL